MAIIGQSSRVDVKKPQDTKGQLVRLLILVVVASASVTLYGLVISLIFGLGLSQAALVVLGACGAGIGFFAWALLSLS